MIILQKINPAGRSNGEVGYNPQFAKIVLMASVMPAGEDDVLMKFFEDSGVPWAPKAYSGSTLQLLRRSRMGKTRSFRTLVPCPPGHQILSFVSDGEDGFYIAWHDNALSSAVASAWIQHVNAQGGTVSGQWSSTFAE